MKKLLPEATIICAILLVISYGFAQTWTQTTQNPPLTWEEISCSADGRVVMAVDSAELPIISVDSGNTWTTNITALFAYNSVASSADGTKLFGSSYEGSGFHFYASADSGNTWTQKHGTAVWHVAASSADGTKLFAIGDNTTIWLSTNSGSNWQMSGAPIKSWTSLASSADGTKLIGCGSYQIYISTDSGKNWNWISNTIYEDSVATSSDGRVLLATGIGGTYVSTNFGSSWATSPIGGKSVASSADGKRLIIAGLSPPFYTSVDSYTSSDSGTTWVTNNAQSGWIRVASSADGCRLFATGSKGGIWVGLINPSPQLNLLLSNTNLTFSWIVPSSKFVLQESSDLVSWSNVTNTPTLNLTNLNDELTLSSSNSSGFYRLISQ